jgi:trigger factor
MFRGKINEIHRIEPAEVNQEFFDKYLGEGIVTTEEEAKEKIRENISEYYAGQATAFLHRNIMDKLIDENPMEMPKEFIRKWLIRNNEEVTAEQIDSEIDAFITNMKWDLISDQVKEKYEAEVKTEDVRAKIKVQISQYFGGQMPNMDIEPLVDNLMKDEKQFKQAYQEAASEKVLQSVADNITLVEEEVSLEKFGEMVKEMNERLEKR